MGLSIMQRAESRGTVGDVLGVPALWLDLDFKPTGVRDRATAEAIISTLSGLIGADPVYVVHTGGGMQPIWRMTDDFGGIPSVADMRPLLLRFKFLAVRVARTYDAHIDSVFDAARVLRVPGSFNSKYGEPRRVVAEPKFGAPLSVTDLAEALDAYGVPKISETETIPSPVTAPSYRVWSAGVTPGHVDEWDWREPSTKVDPDTGEILDVDVCSYVDRMLDGWNTDPIAGRHPWLMRCSVRIMSAWRSGCLTEEGYTRAVRTMVRRFLIECQRAGDSREVGRKEVEDALDWARFRVATKTDVDIRTELGDHLLGERCDDHLVSGKVESDPAVQALVADIKAARQNPEAAALIGSESDAADDELAHGLGSGDGYGRISEQEFWTYSRFLSQCYALSRTDQPTGRWAVLGIALAGLAARVHPCVVLPNRGSLNLASVIVASSGGGKGTAMKVGTEGFEFRIADPEDTPFRGNRAKNKDPQYLDPEDIRKDGIASGERVVSVYAERDMKGVVKAAEARHVITETTEDISEAAAALAATVEVEDEEESSSAVAGDLLSAASTDMLVASTSAHFNWDEIDTLISVKGRMGSTLMPMLRSMMMGERLASDTVDASKRRIVASGSYRASITISAQMENAGPLLAGREASGGTPQRFLWLQVQGPDLDPPIDFETVVRCGVDADENPTTFRTYWAVKPMQIDLPDFSGKGHPRSPVDEGTWRNAVSSVVDEFRDARPYFTLGVDPTVLDEMTEARHNVNRIDLSDPRGTSIDQMAGHRHFIQLRVAALLAIADGRTSVTRQDWRMAAVVMFHSDGVMQFVQTQVARADEAAAVAAVSRATQATERARGSREASLTNRIISILIDGRATATSPMPLGKVLDKVRVSQRINGRAGTREFIIEMIKMGVIEGRVVSDSEAYVWSTES
jgi:hypothetical protein